MSDPTSLSPTGAFSASPIHQLVLAPSSLRPAFSSSAQLPSESEIVAQAAADLQILNASVSLEDPLNPVKIGEATVSMSPRLRFEQTKASRHVDYRYDGDLSLETEDAKAQRRELKNDPMIRAWIDVFWKSYRKSEVQVPFDVYQQSLANSGSGAVSTTAATSTSNDSNNLPVKMMTIEGIPKSEYMRVHGLMYRCLHTNYAQSHATHAGQRDWTRDIWLSSSPHVLDQVAHMASLFELVDIWTLTMERDEYIHFLAVLFHRISRMRSWLNVDGQIESRYVWRKIKHVNSASCYRPFNYAKYSAIRWKRWQQVLHQVDDEDKELQHGASGSDSDDDSEFTDDSGTGSEDTSDDSDSPIKSRSQAISELVQPVPRPINADDHSDNDAHSTEESPRVAASRTSSNGLVVPNSANGSRSAELESDSWRLSSDESDDSDSDSEDQSPLSHDFTYSSESHSRPVMESELERAKRQLAELESTKAEIRERLNKERQERALISPSNNNGKAELTVSLVPPTTSLLGPPPATAETEQTSADESEMEPDEAAIRASLMELEYAKEERARITALQTQLSMAEAVIQQRRDEVERGLMEAMKDAISHDHQPSGVQSDDGAYHRDDDEDHYDSSTLSSTTQSSRASPRAQTAQVDTGRAMSAPSPIATLLSAASSIEAADILSLYGLSPSQPLSARTAHELGVQALRVRRSSHAEIDEDAAAKLKDMISAVQQNRTRAQTLHAMKKRVKEKGAEAAAGGAMDDSEIEEISEYIEDLIQEKKKSKKKTKGKKSAKGKVKAVKDSAAAASTTSSSDKPSKSAMASARAGKAAKAKAEPKSAADESADVSSELDEESQPESDSQLAAANGSKTSSKATRSSGSKLKPTGKSTTLTKPSTPAIKEEEEGEEEPAVNTLAAITSQPTTASLSDQLTKARERERLPAPSAADASTEIPSASSHTTPKKSLQSSPLQSQKRNASKSKPAKAKSPFKSKVSNPVDLAASSTNAVTLASPSKTAMKRVKSKPAKEADASAAMQPPSATHKAAAIRSKPVTEAEAQKPAKIDKEKESLESSATSDSVQIAASAAKSNDATEARLRESSQSDLINAAATQEGADNANKAIKLTHAKSSSTSQLSSNAAADSKSTTQYDANGIDALIEPSSVQALSTSASSANGRQSSKAAKDRATSRDSTDGAAGQTLAASQGLLSPSSSYLASITTSPSAAALARAHAARDPFSPGSTSGSSVNERTDGTLPEKSEAVNLEEASKVTGDSPGARMSVVSSQVSSVQSRSKPAESERTSAASNDTVDLGASEFHSIETSRAESRAQLDAESEALAELETCHSVTAGENGDNDDINGRNSQHRSENDEEEPEVEESNESKIERASTSEAASRFDTMTDATTRSVNSSRPDSASIRHTADRPVNVVTEDNNEPGDMEPSTRVSDTADLSARTEREAVSHDTDSSDRFVASTSHQSPAAPTAAERFAARQAQREQAKLAAFSASENSVQSMAAAELAEAERVRREEQDRLVSLELAKAQGDMVRRHQSMTLQQRWKLREEEDERNERRARADALKRHSEQELEARWKAKQEKMVAKEKERQQKMARIEERRKERELRRQLVAERRAALAADRRARLETERAEAEEIRELAILKARMEFEEREMEAARKREERQALQSPSSLILSPYSFAALAQPAAHGMALCTKPDAKAEAREARRAAREARKLALAEERFRHLTEKARLREQRILEHEHEMEAQRRARFAHALSDTNELSSYESADPSDELVDRVAAQILDDWQWQWSVASGFAPNGDAQPKRSLFEATQPTTKLPRLAVVPSASFAATSSVLNPATLAPSLRSPRVVAVAAQRLNSDGGATFYPSAEPDGGLLRVPSPQPVPYATHTASASQLHEFIARHPLVTAMSLGQKASDDSFDFSAAQPAVSVAIPSDLVTVRAAIRRQLLMARDVDRLRLESELKRQRRAEADIGWQRSAEDERRQFDAKEKRIHAMIRARENERELHRMQRILEAEMRRADRQRQQTQRLAELEAERAMKLALMQEKEEQRRRQRHHQAEQQMWARLKAKIDEDAKVLVDQWKREKEQQDKERAHQRQHDERAADETRTRSKATEEKEFFLPCQQHQERRDHHDRAVAHLKRTQLMLASSPATSKTGAVGHGLAHRAHAHGLLSAMPFHPSFNPVVVEPLLPSLMVLKHQPRDRKVAEPKSLTDTHGSVSEAVLSPVR